MSRLTGIVLCCLAVSLGACSKSEEPATTAPANSRVPEDNVFSGQVQSLEKAEQVQNMIDSAAARQRETIDQQTR